ncbi:MAG: hypothetical protein L0229_23015 [Blastocatellia bacterium]|nr:hypothetical protein [Blastocatellia bacterium]
MAITIPEHVYRQAERLAQLTHRPVDELLAEAITLSLAPLDVSSESSLPVEGLSDQEVLDLTNLELPAAQDRRLSRLLDRQQAGKLTDKQRAELISLMQVYQEGLLRKAQALGEAVQRGLIEPLTP